MAEITDTAIEDWSITPADNAPADSDKVGRNLPKQWRNKKSVFRGLSLEKEWVRFGKRTVSADADAFPGLSFAHQSTDGDLTGDYRLGRKMRLRPVGGTGDTVYGIIWSSSYTTITTAYVSVVAGEPVDAREYWVDLGAASPGNDGLPLFTETGNITIADTATTGAITFARKQPDVDYFLKTTVRSTTSAVAGAATVIGTAKTQTGATITLHDAPTAGFNTIVGWWLLRELR